MTQSTPNQWINYIVRITMITFLVSCSTIPTEQLFEEYYENPVLSQQMLGDTTSLLQVGNTAYQHNNFKDAIQQYEIFAGQNPEAFEVELYLGASYLSDNQIDLAIITFENIKEHGKQKAQATWLLALSYLKNKDVNNCKDTLATLLKDKTLKATSELQEKANNLFEKL